MEPIAVIRDRAVRIVRGVNSASARRTKTCTHMIDPREPIRRESVPRQGKRRKTGSRLRPRPATEKPQAARVGPSLDPTRAACFVRKGDRNHPRERGQLSNCLAIRLAGTCSSMIDSSRR